MFTNTTRYPESEIDTIEELDVKMRPEPTAVNRLDSEEAQGVLAMIEGWLNDEFEIQRENRVEQATDEDYYDHIQWNEQDRLTLESRGQIPLVMNRIKPVVDWAIGTERKTRTDFYVVPREDDDVNGASVKTKTLKYLHDVNKARFNRSKAFEDCVKVGVGWQEDGAYADPENEKIYTRHESWRNIWFDSRCVELEYPTKARYIFRRRKVDLDVALSYFPERINVIKNAATQTATTYAEDEEWYWLGTTPVADEDGRVKGSSMGNRITSATTGRDVHTLRPMVDIYECWFRMPSVPGTKVMRSSDGDNIGPLHNTFYDEQDELHNYLVTNEYATLHSTRRMRVYCAIFVPGFLLELIPSPYHHNRLPFTPVWAWRRGRDGMPYGMIRGLRSPQDDLNKRHQKALHLLITKQVIYQKKAIEDIDEFMSELARPDGSMEVNDVTGVQILDNTVLANEHLQVMQLDGQYILENSGVTPDNLGIKTNAISGEAIKSRQQQGSTTTYLLFDNMLLSNQLQGETQLSLVEQFYNDEKIIKIIGRKGAAEYLKLNQKKEDGTIENDITARAADFIIAEKDYRESVRVAMVEELMSLVSKLPPEFAMNMLDLIVDMTDLENKDELVGRIRKLNGQVDPQEEQKKQGPDEGEQLQQQVQMQQIQNELAKGQLENEKLKQEIAKIQAQTQQIMQGMAFDEREMRVREAEAVTNIKAGDFKRSVTPVTKPTLQMPGPYLEQGLKSNNLENI